MRRLRVGLAGLGRMGRIHAASLAWRCPSARLAGVTDAVGATAAAVGAELDVPVLPSYEALLSGVDAVVIATPTGTHADLITRAARAGKAIFCEKPVSLDRPATVAALAAVAAAGVPLQVGFHRRFDPDWVAAAERIHAGDLGRVYLFRTSLRDMRSPRPQFLAGSGGFFVDVTIHDLDVARWLVGEIVEIGAHGAALSDPGFAELGDIDTALVTLRFENGALGVIDNSRSAGYGYECSTEVVGSAATVRIENPPRHHYRWLTPGQATAPLVEDFEQRYPWAYAAELEAFARAVLDGVPPAVTGTDALAAFDLAGAADRACRTGRPVPVRPHRTEHGVSYPPDDAAGHAEGSR
ncbi:MAG TPA: Gfo/Idh/MocA family oxidoreductase [Mycobacteriales bacterium]|nr:Gfo/Idh/MocA family oxidoreductase [Mycobacteriales bacterium]